MRREFAAVRCDAVAAHSLRQRKREAANPAAEAPPPGEGRKGRRRETSSKVDHPEQFSLWATAGKHSAAPGSLKRHRRGSSPDVCALLCPVVLSRLRPAWSRSTPAIGDEVKKGPVAPQGSRSSDISGGLLRISQGAVVNEQFDEKVQLDRAKFLFDQGAIAKKEPGSSREQAEE